MRGGTYVNDPEKLKILTRIALQMTNAAIPEKDAKRIARAVAEQTLDRMRDLVLYAERPYEKG